MRTRLKICFSCPTVHFSKQHFWVQIYRWKISLLFIHMTVLNSSVNNYFLQLDYGRKFSDVPKFLLSMSLMHSEAELGKTVVINIWSQCFETIISMLAIVWNAPFAQSCAPIQFYAFKVFSNTEKYFVSDHKRLLVLCRKTAFAHKEPFNSRFSRKIQILCYNEVSY